MRYVALIHALNVFVTVRAEAANCVSLFAA